MMLVDNPWPVTTRAPGPSSDDRRQRTRAWPWASSPALTALISYSVRTGCQPRTGWSPASTAPNSALTGPLPVDLGGALVGADGQRHRAGRLATARRRDAPADQRDRSRDLRRALLDEGEQVGVGDLLLGVGQRDGLAVDLVECLALELVAQLPELALEAATAGQLADRQLAAGQPDRLGRHDLVGQRVLDHAVLVDPGLVGEGVAADDRLVRLDREPGQVADQAAGGGELLGHDARPELRELGGSRPQRHDHFLERGVARSLAEAVDRDLDLAGPGLDRRPSVLAVASPRSLWQWTLTVAWLPTSSTTRRVRSPNSAGIA